VQREGSPIEEIRPGDVVWSPSNEKHWHGATPTTATTHIAIQEALDGKGQRETILSRIKGKIKESARRMNRCPKN
jgi:quercetin dioxygenase-like cupin family protein